MRITAAGNVGIGTSVPGALLQIASPTTEGVAPKLYLTDSYTGGKTWELQSGIPSVSDAYFGIKNVNDGVQALTITQGGNVGIGNTNPQYLLSVNGQIGAKDVIVTNNGWSDYVFQPSYRLRPLKEVASYIEANHHLPDIPSEAEVKEKGVSVADMQAKLLAKIEELTLHMIQQEKDNQELRNQNRGFQNRIARLEGQVAH